MSNPPTNRLLRYILTLENTLLLTLPELKDFSIRLQKQIELLEQHAGSFSDIEQLREPEGDESLINLLLL